MKNILWFLWAWVIFNIFIGIYEIYCYQNRNLLNLERFPIWNSSVLATWNEYCRVDPRYVVKPYVWNFELLNAFYAFVFIFVLLYYPEGIVPLLLLEIISCSLYFMSLGYEFMVDEDLYQTMLANSTITDRVLYYGISSIWIIVPAWLYISFTRSEE